MEQTKIKPVRAMSISEFFERFPNAETARTYLEQQRWSNGVSCPRCGSASVTVLPSKRRQIGLWQCNGCRKQFNVRTNSVFQHSNLPLNKWLLAFYLLSVAAKGEAATLLATHLKIKLETAWFLGHRVRKAMEGASHGYVLEGIVECDETFIGGKEGKKHVDARLWQGGGTAGKLALWGAAERGGRKTIIRSVEDENATLQELVGRYVKKGSIVCIDGTKAYDGLPASDYTILKVDHSKKQYRKGIASTNLIESVWSPLKKGYHGIYQKISHKHIQRYAHESTFRRIHLESATMEKMDSLAQGAFRGWLGYRELASGGKPYYVSEEYRHIVDERLEQKRKKQAGSVLS